MGGASRISSTAEPPAGNGPSPLRCRTPAGCRRRTHPKPWTVNRIEPDSASLPWAPAADENKQAILTVLQRHLRSPASVLELGAGTGQHAVHFATALPWLRWLASELPALLPGLAARLALAGLP
ncbi:MAG: DUF938 domain-containing protein, partial [Lysobacterales bacterium]